MDIARYFIELSKKLSRYGNTHFILDGKNYFPHITIYSPEFSVKNIYKIYENIQNIKAERQKLKVISKTTSEGYIGVEFKLTDSIYKIHKEVISLLNPFRDGHIHDKYKDKYYLEGCTKKQKLYIQDYGYPRVMDLYQPHLSIIRFQDKKVAEKVLKKLNIDIEEFLITEIGIYEMGEHGTYVRIQKCFNL